MKHQGHRRALFRQSKMTQQILFVQFVRTLYLGLQLLEGALPQLALHNNDAAGY